MVVRYCLKAIGIPILTVIILIVITLVCTSILHQVKLRSNKEFMTQQGYYTPVLAGDHYYSMKASF